MKTSLLFWTSMIYSVGLCGQIPNGGFEDWDRIYNFETPAIWKTNADSLLDRFSRDTMRIEGEYSLKILSRRNEMWGRNCTGELFQRIKLPAPVGSDKFLTFYSKVIPDSIGNRNGAFIGMDLAFYSAGKFVSAGGWSSRKRIDTFTKFMISIPNHNIDSLYIKIYGGASNGAADPCFYKSFGWFDDLRIEDIQILNSDNEKLYKDATGLCFNNQGFIQVISPGHSWNKYYLYSIEGKLLSEGNIYSNQIALDRSISGLVFIRLSDGNNNVISKKLFLVSN